MYLLKVRIEQIAEYWPLFKQAISSSLPPQEAESQELMTDILQQLMAGKMQAWVAHKKATYPIESVGILTTVIITEPVSRRKSLWIYTLYGWADIPDALYVAGLETLKTYAKAEGCQQITFYTTNQRIVNIASQVGIGTEYTFGIVTL